MDLSVVIPACIISGAALIWGFYAIAKLIFKARDQGEQDKRVDDLKKALETAKMLAADRRLALDNKTKEIYDLKFSNMEFSRSLDKEQDKYDRLLGQKKSTEIRVGQISEQIAPFLHAWPYKAGKFRFLGSPIDGVSFEDDCVVFVEIKTGKGRLTPSQLRVRKQVREGKVKWVEFRVDPDGINIKEG